MDTTLSNEELRADEAEAMIMTEESVEAENNKPTPRKRNNNKPSERTLKKTIKELETKVEELELQIQSSDDRALIFQEENAKLRKHVQAIKQTSTANLQVANNMLLNIRDFLTIAQGGQ